MVTHTHTNINIQGCRLSSTCSDKGGLGDVKTWCATQAKTHTHIHREAHSLNLLCLFFCPSACQPTSLLALCLYVCLPVSLISPSLSHLSLFSYKRKASSFTFCCSSVVATMCSTCLREREQAHSARAHYRWV